MKNDGRAPTPGLRQGGRGGAAARKAGVRNFPGIVIRQTSPDGRRTAPEPRHSRDTAASGKHVTRAAAAQTSPTHGQTQGIPRHSPAAVTAPMRCLYEDGSTEEYLKKKECPLTAPERESLYPYRHKCRLLPY